MSTDSDVTEVGRQRVVFMGSGAFGLPTLDALRRVHDVPLVISQPDRPAGRKRSMTPTPIAARALDVGVAVERPDDVNDDATHARLAEIAPDAIVVIAYGQKLGTVLLDTWFAINLHASLLPRYRGAAPINRAMINGDARSGVSVIALAQRMDAGVVYATRSVAIDPMETAGELHDRLAERGPDVILEVLEQHRTGQLEPVEQDDAEACPAPKFTKADGTVTFDQPASAVRARIHGLTPWPGCTVLVDGARLKLLRVRDRASAVNAAPGTVLDDLSIACAEGSVELLSVQPEGKSAMALRAYAQGNDFTPGTVVTSLS